MKILFLIRSLGTGGAERQLVTLASALQEQGHNVTVACLYDVAGDHKDQLEKQGVEYHCLTKKGRWDVIGFWRSLLCYVRAVQPDVFHSYMPLQNILALSLKPFIKAKIVCGIRIAMVDLRSYDRLTRFVYWLEGWLIRGADGVISNSHAALHLYQSKRHRTDHFHLISNGVDFEKFQIDPLGAKAFRRQHSIPTESVLLGGVGRFDPQKNIKTFLKSARQILDHYPEAFFIWVGEKKGSYYESWVAFARVQKLADRFCWVDKQSDMSAVYSALDMLCLTSHFKGFPNVLVEALACGTPCLSTDAGDASFIFNDQSLGCTTPTQGLEQSLVPKLSAFLESRKEVVQSSLNNSFDHDNALKRRESVQSRFSVKALRERTEQALRKITDA